MRKLLSIMSLILFFSCEEKSNTTSLQLEVSNSYLEKVAPPNWWIGFNNQDLQLLVKEDRITNYQAEIDYPGVHLIQTIKAESPNYVFLNIHIDKNTQPGTFDIVFKYRQTTKKHTYELKQREVNTNELIGFNSSDAVYLITPDRFANGDTTNDFVKELLETEIDRTHNYKRHGGDIKGITKHLDYIEKLGFTSIWPTPLLINDMPESSYHGYAITDYYQVDPRFGSLEDYKELSLELHDRNMKLIMDQVVNHCGLNHWWMEDLPFKDWINFQEHYIKNKATWNWETVITSNHRRTTNQDRYASQKDKKLNSDGWFVPQMPDLNQRNPFMATYLIQNSIWWIETLRLAGIRQDTYPYAYKEFMSRWAKAITEEYPNFTIVGEEWSYNPLLIGYWQQGANNKDGYQSNLKSTMDFAMQRNIVEALNEEESWDKGLIKIYEGLANDFHYAKPKDIMIFPDNHDMSRIFTQLKGNIINTKMALSYMLVLPRIPQIYYGTEILMNDFEKPGDHGLIRSDFPGGWKGDSINAFTKEGLSSEQIEMQSFLTKILNYRKRSKAIQEGKTVHFAPIDGVYVLFRTYNNEVVVHIMNKNKTPITLDLERFEEMKLKGRTFKNIITNESFIWNNTIELKEEGSILLTTIIEE
ncbi:Glycosidase [Tenacibaculum sp. MAR_2009_124]|uniref:glycoside hydrolase family 13 protein n=1 Tax=Tenacibaculum sp. MAR_2009_124 TaxID=1250059 RepID=UPI00089567ED|nr:glycoside hydrolase family 13 protein [Tenacibaculum sp. MAR_2009_124]SEB48883.1 Glycosidase [Tenacibaculum sp. MAR_2009_124]